MDLGKGRTRTLNLLLTPSLSFIYKMHGVLTLSSFNFLIRKVALKLLHLITLKGVLNEMPAKVKFNFSPCLLMSVVGVCMYGHVLRRKISTAIE